VTAGIRVRLEAGEAASQIAMIEGSATFSSPAAELGVTEGQTVKVEPANSARFALYREVAPVESDRWNEERDQALESSSASAHLPDLHYGLDDLDAHGAWIATDEHGMTWKPAVEQDWAPFRNGRWTWYPEIGFTWVSADPWGWLPYHYGRWTRSDSHGWLSIPGKVLTLKPGDAYWLRAAGMAGWGPLAPGETWTAGAVPRLYLHAHTTYARFAPEARELDPDSLPRPRESLPNAVFAAALPSPPLAASRLDARRPVLRAGSTRIVPLLAGVAFGPGPAVQQAATPPELAPSLAPPPVAQAAPQPAAPQPDYQPMPSETTVVVPVPVETPVYYPAPVYTGVIVVNPPERKKPQEKPRGRSPGRDGREAEAPRPASPQPLPPAQAIRRVSRDEAPREERRAPERREERKPEPPPKAEERPIPRDTNDAGRSRRER
jgi:hypothetical protein